MTIKVLFDGFLRIEEIETEIKGRKVKRENLKIKNAVAGIIKDKNNRIALVKQFRPCINQDTLELPAGTCDKDLPPIDILIEELEEECEINKEHIISSTLIQEYFMTIGFSDSIIQVYLVELSSEEKNKKVQDNDVEEVIWVTLEEFGELVQSGVITDSKTLMAYYYLKANEV